MGCRQYSRSLAEEAGRSHLCPGAGGTVRRWGRDCTGPCKRCQPCQACCSALGGHRHRSADGERSKMDGACANSKCRAMHNMPCKAMILIMGLLARVAWEAWGRVAAEPFQGKSHA